MVEPFSTSLMVNIPSRSVMAPLVVPFTTTLAPMTGSPRASLTCPLTVSFWANTNVGNNNRHNKGIIPLRSLFFNKMFFIRRIHF